MPCKALTKVSYNICHSNIEKWKKQMSLFVAKQLDDFNISRLL